VFVSWLALLAAPLFDEVTFFGVQLRRQIDEVRTDLTREIAELKTEVRNSIDFRATVGHQIAYFASGAAPPSDEEIQANEGRVHRTVEETLRSYGVQPEPDEAEVTQVPDAARYLFGVRYNLEGELRRIWQATGFREASKGPLSIGRMISGLVREEVLDPELALVIRQAHSICSAAVHGDTVSTEQRQFVESTAPGLIAFLHAIDWTVERVPLNEA